MIHAAGVYVARASFENQVGLRSRASASASQPRRNSSDGMLDRFGLVNIYLTHAKKSSTVFT